ncbi:hypothetical protein ACFRA3_35850, partial [Streptomyces cyaneofuscatus]
MNDTHPPTTAGAAAAEAAERLIAEYRALPPGSDRKREIITELDANAQALPFLVSVVADAEEYD